MKNKTLFVTLLACMFTAFVFTLGRYALSGHNPSNRLGYGIFMTVIPAIGTLLLLKLAKRSSSWRWTVVVYFLLFGLITIIQSYGRTMPVN